MDALIYLPTIQSLMWNQDEPLRAVLSELVHAVSAPRAYVARASIRLNLESNTLLIERIANPKPLLFFEALEMPQPLIARQREFWYPQLTARVRPERQPKQARPDALVAWGPPQQPLSSIRDNIAINDPRNGHYIGRAFWRVDKQGYWGCWSDATENSGPCLTMAELCALLSADKGIFAD